MSTRRSILLGLLASPVLLTSIACQKSDSQSTNTKVLIGGTAIVASGAQPIDDSVILISAGRIRMVGTRRDVPISQDSQRTDLTGKWIMPAPGGRLAIDEPATLLVLNSNNPNDIARRMNNGEWQ